MKPQKKMMRRIQQRDVVVSRFNAEIEAIDRQIREAPPPQMPPTIPTEQEWIATCMALGWGTENIAALRKFYREHHQKQMVPTGRFVVYCGGIEVKKSFVSREAAEDWSKYNYKHRKCWEVLPEMKPAPTTP